LLLFGKKGEAKKIHPPVVVVACRGVERGLRGKKLITRLDPRKAKQRAFFFDDEDDVGTAMSNLAAGTGPRSRPPFWPKKQGDGGAESSLPERNPIPRTRSRKPDLLLSSRRSSPWSSSSSSRSTLIRRLFSYLKNGIVFSPSFSEGGEEDSLLLLMIRAVERRLD